MIEDICGSKDAPIWQDRPSGRKLAIQRWWFCSEWWQRHCRICGTVEPTAIAV